MAALCDALVSQRLRAHQDTLLVVLYSLAASDNLAYFRKEFLSAYVAQLPGVGMQEQQVFVLVTHLRYGCQTGVYLGGWRFPC